MIGQDVSLPLFAGFKIQNSIKAYDNMYLAETASAMQTKEDVATSHLLLRKYTKHKTVELLKENQKYNNVDDFS
jgi:hypothetical protein